MSSAESALLAQIRAGQEQTNARLEALLVAIRQLCDLVARLAPVDVNERSCLRPADASEVHDAPTETQRRGGE